MRTIKKCFSTLIVLCVILCSSVSYVAYAATLNSDTGAEVELQPMATMRCGFTSHFSDMEYWPNGNLKSVTITPLFPNGNPSGEPYTMEYPESGEGSFVFHGCQCPACRNN